MQYLYTTLSSIPGILLIAASVLLFPKPFGFQAEYNVGRGPEFNVINKTIEETNLKGGYVQSMYKLNIKEQIFIPFVKYHWYDGGKKHELDARSYDVNDLEIGVEWQPFKNFELVADYTISNRQYEDAENEKKRRIKIVSPALIDTVLNNFKDLL